VGAPPDPHANGHHRRDGIPARQDEGFEDQRGFLRLDESVGRFDFTSFLTLCGFAWNDSFRAKPLRVGKAVNLLEGERQQMIIEHAPVV
jgi:hypothetical protein